jgi:hypothetical protein
MTLVFRKTYDWQEDLDDFDFTKWCMKNRSHTSYRAHTKLSWKGKLRKLFGIKKPTQGEIKP